MIQRFMEVVPGKLYRGSAPSPVEVLQLKNQLHINKIVSLDEKTGNRIDKVCKLLNINHIKLYIEDNRGELLKAITQNLKHLLIDGGPTYLHCKMGKDRTSLIIALFKCQYLGVSASDALKEALSIGMGIGMPEKIKKLYEKIILNCKKLDTNNADVVSNEREYMGDNRDSFLDEAHQGSFSPYLDHTRQNPIDAVYNYTVDQTPTRQNYFDQTSLYQYDPNKGDILPNIGEYDNDGQARGFGPSESYNGFFSEISH